MLCVAAATVITAPPALLLKAKPRSYSWYRHHEETYQTDMHRPRCNSLPMRKNCESAHLVIQHNDLWLQWYRCLREHDVGHSLSWPELCNTVIETHHDVRIPLDTIEAEDLSWSLEEAEEESLVDVLSALSDSSLPPLKILPLVANLATMEPAEIPTEKEKVPRRLLHGMKRAFKRRSPRRGLKALQRSVSERVLHFSGNSQQQQHQHHRIYSQTPRGQSSADGMKLPT